jgi:hypothetical protein
MQALEPCWCGEYHSYCGRLLTCYCEEADDTPWLRRVDFGDTARCYKKGKDMRKDMYPICIRAGIRPHGPDLSQRGCPNQ